MTMRPMRITAMGALWFAAFLFPSGSRGSAGGLVRIDQGGRCGYADAAGKVIVTPRYRACGDFSEGLAPVRDDRGWGYVAETGDAVIAPQFAAADAFSEGRAFVELDAETKAVIDSTGKVLFRGAYYDHGSFHSGLAPVFTPEEFECWTDASAGKREILNAEERKHCPPGHLGASTRGTWIYIDAAGSIAIPASFQEAGDFHEGLARVRTKDGVEFIDPSGKTAFRPGPNIDSLGDFSEGVAVAAHRTDYSSPAKYGYIGKHGVFIAPPAYDLALKASNGRGLVRSGGKYGYVDSASGNLVVAPQYENALSFSEGLAPVREGGRWGYIDVRGDLAIGFQFDSAGEFRDGRATVSRGTSTATIDPTGTAVNARPASLLAQTFSRLQEFRYPYLPDVIGSSLPEGLHPLLAQYREQLRGLTAQTLQRFRGPAVNPEEVQAAIEEELQSVGIRDMETPVEPRPYGLLSVEVIRPAEQPELLAVTFRLNLATQSDGSFSLFHLGRAGWELVQKADHSGDYESPEDVYQFEVPQFTRSDEHGAFLMLQAWTDGNHPTWGNALTAELYRSDTAFHGERIFRGEYGAKEWSFVLDPDGFRLEIVTYSIEDGPCCETYPFRYRVKNGVVERVAPVAFSPRQFLGVWGEMPWEEASRWSDPQNLAELRGAHEVVGQRTIFSIQPEEFCDAGTWQVRVCAKDDDDCASPSTSTYYVVEQTGPWAFVLKKASHEALSGCRIMKDPRWKSTMFEKPPELRPFQ